MDEARKVSMGRMVVAASWLAVFCLFGYRATFSVLLRPMSESMGWSVTQLSLGYSLMMSVYAITAFFSGMIIDRWGTRPAYAIGAVCAALGFYITSNATTYLEYLIPYALFAGIGTGMLWVSSTVSVRKWYVGNTYASMWGIAFMGAPIAQVVLSLGVKQILLTMNWQHAMKGLAVVVFVALAMAALLARKNPEDYGLEPFGLVKAPAGSGPKPQEYIWNLGDAFKRYAIWGAIIAFLTSMLAEFLIWTQVVNYWTNDVNLSLASATNLYVIIGIAGIFTMPLMGKVADKVVARYAVESQGRKVMLIFAPSVGVLACICLLLTKVSYLFGVLACILFAVYWAIEPGGVAGYAGSVYGRQSLGKIWGLATLIVMGIGPAVGVYMGAYLFDISGSYMNSILFATGAFLVSAVVAASLPLKAEPPVCVDSTASLHTS
ncbi:Sugar phosphate permease [Thermosyntropha lipolytica DSM 11003]|uniref:Sugar phosphate permease n=1 Tax=Thermosyntropha lipolytica DSM 11003 TaxID=1123382 RepID=A0A1M5LUL2_9FIRM|nr:MFS transporter [Thermosyntropha lipolytica]SHG68711.1 Sugar phosphate permease [Thermosyntropha lipolytica DSM 11003]